MSVSIYYVRVYTRLKTVAKKKEGVYVKNVPIDFVVDVVVYFGNREFVKNHQMRQVLFLVTALDIIHIYLLYM